MRILKSYLIIILTVLTFLFILGCDSKKINKQSEPEQRKKELIKTELEIIQESLLSLHNEERLNRKLEVFVLDKKLCEYAQNHASNMLSKNRLVHSDISEVGAQAVAENIAYGQENEKEVTEAWMHSYFHRLNILNKRYKKVGFGCVNKDGKVYWCAVFTN